MTNNKIVGGGPAKLGKFQKKKKPEIIQNKTLKIEFLTEILGAWPWMARVAFKVNVNGTIRPDFKCGKNNIKI